MTTFRFAPRLPLRPDLSESELREHYCGLAMQAIIPQFQVEISLQKMTTQALWTSRAAMIYASAMIKELNEFNKEKSNETK